jgi:hypothetical protein
VTDINKSSFLQVHKASKDPPVTTETVTTVPSRVRLQDTKEHLREHTSVLFIVVSQLHKIQKRRRHPVSRALPHQAEIIAYEVTFVS